MFVHQYLWKRSCQSFHDLIESTSRLLNQTPTSPCKDWKKVLMNDFKVIYEALEGIQVLLCCNMVLSSKLRKIIKKIGRKVMKYQRQFQWFIVLPNLGLNYNGLIVRYNNDLKRWWISIIIHKFAWLIMTRRDLNTDITILTLFKWRTWIKINNSRRC